MSYTILKLVHQINKNNASKINVSDLISYLKKFSCFKNKQLNSLSKIAYTFYMHCLRTFKIIIKQVYAYNKIIEYKKYQQTQSQFVNKVLLNSSIISCICCILMLLVNVV